MNPKEIALKTAQKRREAVSALRDTGLAAQQRAEELRRKRQGQTQVLQAKAEEQEILSWDIPGLFPTPPDLADRMVYIAMLGVGLQQGDSVLEPSAGTGNIAQAIQRGGYRPVCVEVNYTLAERLRKQGFDTYCENFLEFRRGEFKAIIMNPPFERQQDIDHVYHAWGLLRANGRLVAIISEGTFFRSDSKAREFRGWLENWKHDIETLPKDTFKSVGTSVASRLVIIDNLRRD